MIVVELIGGLGNQLFQYCIARHLAEIHQTELILDLCAFDKYKLHKFSLQHFNLKAKIINSINDPLPDNLNQITEKSLNYNQKILKSPNNSRLQGYFQSSLYFQNISRIIRNDIVLKLQQKGKDLKTAEEINNTNSVSIHVRRSDYISDKATNDIVRSNTKFR
jgi:hypothetical protein